MRWWSNGLLSVSNPGDAMNEGPLDRLRIVLVEPTHPGNIGAAARAMKAMGLDRLCLVAPGPVPERGGHRPGGRSR